MRLRLFGCAILVGVFCLAPVWAEDGSPPITADNIHQLQSVSQFDFADLPESAGIVDNGWFAINPDANYLATINRNNDIVLWDVQSGFVKTSSSACEDYDGRAGGFIDGSFQMGNPIFVAAYITGQTSYIGYHPVDDMQQPEPICDIPGTPLHVWNSPDASTWVELLPSDPMRKPFVEEWTADSGALDYDTHVDLLSGPENDSRLFHSSGTYRATLRHHHYAG